MMMAARSPALNSASCKRARKRQRHFLEVGISQPGLFLVAIGFDQAGFVRPAVQRVAQRSAQAGILIKIEH